MRRLLIVLCAGLLLTGCQPPTRPPHTAAPPVFASEDAAVAAAEEALALYIAAVNRMGQSGGTDFSGYEGVVSEHQLADEKKDAANLRSDGEHMAGDFTTFGFRVETFADVNGSAALHARFCLDLTEATFVDSEGRDLAAESHRPASTLQAFFRSDGAQPTFIVDEVRRWEREESCLPD